MMKNLWTDYSLTSGVRNAVEDAFSVHRLPVDKAPFRPKFHIYNSSEKRMKTRHLVSERSVNTLLNQKINGWHVNTPTIHCNQMKGIAAHL